MCKYVYIYKYIYISVCACDVCYTNIHKLMQYAFRNNYGRLHKLII